MTSAASLTRPSRSSLTAAIAASTASSPNFLAHWSTPRSSSLRVGHLGALAGSLPHALFQIVDREIRHLHTPFRPSSISSPPPSRERQITDRAGPEDPLQPYIPWLGGRNTRQNERSRRQARRRHGRRGCLRQNGRVCPRRQRQSPAPARHPPPRA